MKKRVVQSITGANFLPTQGLHKEMVFSEISNPNCNDLPEYVVVISYPWFPRSVNMAGAYENTALCRFDLESHFSDPTQFNFDQALLMPYPYKVQHWCSSTRFILCTCATSSNNWSWCFCKQIQSICKTSTTKQSQQKQIHSKNASQFNNLPYSLGRQGCHC